MRILFDTNVLLDILLDRHPFSEAATVLLQKAELGTVQGYVCATSITTLFYLCSKGGHAKRARTQIGNLLSILEVAGVHRAVLEPALHSSITDFEDAVVAQAALAAGCDLIVTRDRKDFGKSPVTALSPQAVLATLAFSRPDLRR